MRSSCHAGGRHATTLSSPPPASQSLGALSYDSFTDPGYTRPQDPLKLLALTKPTPNQLEALASTPASSRLEPFQPQVPQ
ncbi:hypothetical protein NDU88_005747 [Pleurodeles waltl]|uniref:Uncharacterized protein n=1 Tax=Pleurodeles waltl TaxID=8319 RepID=A0AAV7WVK9_PLEWA|nr:hypothetical protein NDU88_005747 [Pleurodeles waltl]